MPPSSSNEVRFPPPVSGILGPFVPTTARFALISALTFGELCAQAVGIGREEGDGLGALREIRVETSDPIVWCVEHSAAAASAHGQQRG